MSLLLAHSGSFISQIWIDSGYRLELDFFIRLFADTDDEIGDGAGDGMGSSCSIIYFILCIVDTTTGYIRL